MSVDEFNASERSTTSKETGVKLLAADGSAASTTVPSTKQRASRGEKAQAASIKEEKEVAKQVKRAAVLEEKQAAAVAENKGEVMMCAHCGLEYMKEGWWLRHQQWCPGISKQKKGRQRFI